jgi:hypothetical protein
LNLWPLWPSDKFVNVSERFCGRRGRQNDEQTPIA